MLLVLVGAAQNGFASSNRSTPVRVTIFAQMVLFLGWVTYAWLYQPVWPMLVLLLAAAASHCYLCGAVMIGESSVLPPRVRRGLPKSILGKVFLTWFNPGSGTGYTFIVLVFGTITVFYCAAVIIQQTFSVPAINMMFGWDSLRLLTFGLGLLFYFVIYLGITRLVLLTVKNRHRYGAVMPVLLNVVIVTLGCAVPVLIASWREGFNRVEYSMLQITNWQWTLYELANDGGIWAPLVIGYLACGALIVFGLNLRTMAGELRVTPVAALKDEE